MITYQRLHFDDQGIEKGSAKDYSLRWDDVTSVSTRIIRVKNGRYYKSKIETKDNKSISFQCNKILFSFSKLVSYSEALGFLAGKVAEPFICEKTKYVARWGKDIGIIKKLRATTKGPIPNIEDLKSLGNLYLVQFNFWRARRTFRKILAFNPNDADALEGLALADIDSGKSSSKIIPQYEHLVALNPNHTGYLRRLTALMIDKGDPQAEQYASRLISLHPEEIQGRLELGFYHFKKDNPSEAKSIFQTVESITKDERVKAYARSQLEYIDRYETDAFFRKKEEAKKIGRTMLSVVLTYVVPVILILIFLFRIVRRIFKF